MNDPTLIRKTAFFPTAAVCSILCLLSLLATPAIARFTPAGSSYLPALYNQWPIPQPGRLLITEVLYDPPGPEPGGEWIELFNAGGSTVDLEAYKIGDEEIPGEQEGMFQFPPGASIVPGQVIVVACQALTFTELYGLAPDYELRESDPLVPDLVKYTAWAGGNVELGNTGDEVLLLGPGDLRVDGLSWGSSRAILDPPVSRIPGSHSLERYPADVDTDAASDWRDREVPSPGWVEQLVPTATAQVTETSPPGETLTPPPASTLLVINEVHADPDPLQGDANGDGQVDSSEDEFVEIVNVGNAVADLSGWSLQDITGLRHAFPDGTLLPTGCAMIVFGGGSPTGGFGGSLVQDTSQGTLGLNNSGDTLTLLDPGASVVLSLTYGPEGGQDQSLTRSPDLAGPDPLVGHLTAPGSGGARFSPGTKVDGSAFPGCPTN